MKVVVTGGRDYQEFKYLWDTLNYIHDLERITFLAEGGARGVDSMAFEWRLHYDIPGVTYHANWALHGKRAGPVRNKDMLVAVDPDLVVVFPGGIGTEHCARTASNLGLRTFWILSRRIDVDTDL